MSTVHSISCCCSSNGIALSRHAGGHASQHLWSWAPAAQLSLLRSAAKAPLPAPVHSLHPAAASVHPGARPPAVSAARPPQPAAAAAAQQQAAESAAEAAAAPRAGPLVVFADSSTILVSTVGEELRLGPVAAPAGDAAADNQVRATTDQGRHAVTACSSGPLSRSEAGMWTVSTSILHHITAGF